MKKIIYIIALVGLIFSQQTQAQRIGNLDGIYYQAVALDDEAQEIVGIDLEAKPLYNREIGVRFTITKGLDGDVQWEEEHVTTTDEYGLFTLTIGKGSQLSTSYEKLLDIPWIDADQFLKVEISTKNDGNYKMVSNQIFMSVPYAFYADDIADDAITTEKILNEEILSEDIKNETIVKDDIATGAVETSEILDATILNEDIADGTVDLTKKVANVLPVANGGTGVASNNNGGIMIGGGASAVKTLPQATDGQIAVGVTGADPVLKNIVGTGDISVTQNADSIFITSNFLGGVDADGWFETPVGSNGIIGAGEGWLSNNRAETRIGPDLEKPYEMGDILLISVDQDLKGCILSSYIESVTDGIAQVKVVIFNPAKNDVTLTTPMIFKFLHVK